MGRKLFNLKNIAMVAVFSLIAFVGFNSFTSNKGAKVVETTLYHYNGNYVLAGDLPSGANCGGTPTLPCSITVQDTDLPPSYPTIPEEEVETESFDFQASETNGTYTN